MIALGVGDHDATNTVLVPQWTSSSEQKFAEDLADENSGTAGKPTTGNMVVLVPVRVNGLTVLKPSRVSLTDGNGPVATDNPVDAKLDQVIDELSGFNVTGSTTQVPTIESTTQAMEVALETSTVAPVEMSSTDNSLDSLIESLSSDEQSDEVETTTVEPTTTTVRPKPTTRQVRDKWRMATTTESSSDFDRDARDLSGTEPTRVRGGGNSGRDHTGVTWPDDESVFGEVSTMPTLTTQISNEIDGFQVSPKWVTPAITATIAPTPSLEHSGIRVPLKLSVGSDARTKSRQVSVVVLEEYVTFPEHPNITKTVNDLLDSFAQKWRQETVDRKAVEQKSDQDLDFGGGPDDEPMVEIVELKAEHSSQHARRDLMNERAEKRRRYLNMVKVDTEKARVMSANDLAADIGQELDNQKADDSEVVN